MSITALDNTKAMQYRVTEQPEFSKNIEYIHQPSPVRSDSKQKRCHSTSSTYSRKTDCWAIFTVCCCLYLCCDDDSDSDNSACCSCCDNESSDNCGCDGCDC